MITPEVRTSPRKARKPQQRSMALRNAIAAVAADYERMTVRQLYYQLVSRYGLPKTEQAYKRVDDAAVQMRLDGSLNYRKIADGSRTRREPNHFGSLGEIMQTAHASYRKNYWIEQPVHVEIWCEKDALTGVIHPVCERFGVPFVAVRGFSSLTLVYESAQAMLEIAKPTQIYYFGDHDASGRMISKNFERDLQHHGVNVTLERIALEPHQIQMYGLPTRAGKRSDSRHAKFAARYGDECVELDALPPNVLTNLVASVIVKNIDLDAWLRMEEVEALERETLESIASVQWQAGTVYRIAQEQP